MFQFLKKEKAAPVLLESIALFGKLPGMADFTKVNAHLDHAVLVNAEIERMIASLHESDSLSIQSLDIQCVMEQEDAWLLAEICHSQDKSGRTYPFTGVGFITHPLIKECQAALPIMLDPFVQYLHRLKNTIHSKSDLEISLKQTDTLRFTHTKATLLEEEISLLKSVSQGEWVAQAFMCLDKQTIANIITDAGRNVLSFRKGRACQLILPLSQKHKSISTIFWLQWIESLLQPKRWPLHYCTVSSANAAHMHVWFEHPGTLAFTEWVKPVDYAHLPESSNQALNALLMRDDLDLCETLYRWQQEVVRDFA